MILLDTSGLLAALDHAARGHEAAAAVVDRESGPLVLSPFVLAELDYLVTQRLGMQAELELLGEVERGAFELASVDADGIAGARRVIERFRDLRIGLADASLVVLAGRFGTNRVLTLDERHFRALRTPHGDPFVLLPADA